MKIKIAIFSFFLLLNFLDSNGQTSFLKVLSTKAPYSIEIPEGYFEKKRIGVNVDMKYVDSRGASIVTVVKNLPPDIKESDISHLNSASDYEFSEEMAAMGLFNVVVIKKGFIIINGVKSSYVYYRDNELYYHSITQFKRRKILNLTYTCEYENRDLYMPYVFVVVNSIKWK